MKIRNSALLAIAALGLLLGLGFLANQRWAARNLQSEGREAERKRQSDPLLLFGSSLAEVPADARLTVRGAVYVPAYASNRAVEGRARVDLATTLSIHNTSRDRPLILERVDYHNTDGALIQAYLAKPVALKPFGTVEMFVASDDIRGGTGANFVVEWAAQGAMSEPVIETVMIGAVGTTSYSFVSQGRSVRMVGNSKERDDQ
jgi:hypothetical protein